MRVHVSVFSLGKTHSHTTHLHISKQNSWAGRCPDSCEHKNSFNNSFFQTKPALRLSIKVFRKWIVNNWLQVSLPIYKWSKFPCKSCQYTSAPQSSVFKMHIIPLGWKMGHFPNRLSLPLSEPICQFQLLKAAPVSFQISVAQITVRTALQRQKIYAACTF